MFYSDTEVSRMVSDIQHQRLLSAEKTKGSLLTPDEVLNIYTESLAMQLAMKTTAKPLANIIMGSVVGIGGIILLAGIVHYAGIFYNFFYIR